MDDYLSRGVSYFQNKFFFECLYLLFCVVTLCPYSPPTECQLTPPRHQRGDCFPILPQKLYEQFQYIIIFVYLLNIVSISWSMILIIIDFSYLTQPLKRSHHNLEFHKTIKTLIKNKTYLTKSQKDSSYLSLIFQHTKTAVEYKHSVVDCYLERTPRGSQCSRKLKLSTKLPVFLTRQGLF